MITKDKLIALGVDEEVARKVVKEVASNKIELLKEYEPKSKLTKLEEDNIALKDKLKESVGVDVQKQLEDKDKEIEKLQGTLDSERKMSQVNSLIQEQERQPLPNAKHHVIKALNLDELELDEKGKISEKELKKRYENIVKEEEFFFAPVEEGGHKPPKIVGKDLEETKEANTDFDSVEEFLSPILNR